MILAIDLMDETNEVTEEAQHLVESILQFAARKENIEKDTELSVTFVDNDRIREINKEYRNKDSATDVISFALEEMGEDEVEIVGAEMPRMLGDIIISIERTKEQAEEYGHSFDRELGFLALHGFLHLLGFDHMNEEDEKVMFTKQKEILEEYGLSREG
ncbi:rRNA maturation RNase YbeY [Peribacillus sp. NPDC101481]|jgi:probable rRNA maturation factor|uniref:rRNA maturation RNase YbeY n=1 Tax=Bacillaceae TaxID=186817 RepID=UPI000C338B02|nr:MULTISPECIES: rRNA maturation RNase YbeY [Bacillaceae]MBT2645988.1 rRNA maturation RNase YbeY [Bacillus sp. ISL-34]MCT4478436.1 rRNA maturation RNase YbeY [Peribacillus frigoritolerans]PKF88960.1 rRNA maturation RNase YbeY [Bacillus sp. BA3]CAH0229868.1 Endoribonuclease YbeY [Peribacillus sp. Bi134]